MFLLFLLRRGHFHTEDDKHSSNRTQEPPGDLYRLLPPPGSVLVLQLFYQRAQQSVDELRNEYKLELILTTNSSKCQCFYMFSYSN